MSQDCGTPEVYRAPEAAVRAARARSNSAIARHDANGAVAELADECRILASNGALVPNRAAMRDAFSRAFLRPHFISFTRDPHCIELSDDGQVAAEHGRWSSHWDPEAGDAGTGGVYLARWQRQGDRWLIQSELFIPLGGGTHASA